MMFRKVKTVRMYDADVEIRKVKVKEAKELLGKIEDEVNSFINGQYFKNSNKISDIVTEKFEFVKEIILQFTNIKPEDFEDLYVTDIVEILKQMLEFNGIDLKRVSDFFMKILDRGGEAKAESFTEEIPQL